MAKAFRSIQGLLTELIIAGNGSVIMFGMKLCIEEWFKPRSCVAYVT